MSYPSSHISVKCWSEWFIHYIKIFIFVLLLIPPDNTIHAATLSVDLGRDSTSVAAGRDFDFGYGMLGISTIFITDSPWSYVATEGGLNKPCLDFQAASGKYCEPKDRFHDGDEFEVFGKVGYRLPLFSMIYLNAGVGISKQRIADLYIFCVGVEEGSSGTQDCSSSRLFETWGEVDENYYLTLLGGLTVEMTHHLLVNIDYHTRRGLTGGLMWRF